MAGHDETDVSYLRFGQGFEETTFISNAAVAILLEQVKSANADKAFPPAFDQALQYAKKFKGAVKIQDPTAIDEILASLSALEFPRTQDDGSENRLRLHQYELTALTNLNPGTVTAAKSLIPSLDKFQDEEVEEMLKILRRASAKYGAS